MKITRNISGVSFQIELTEDELYNAYLEQELLFDKESICDYIKMLEVSEISKEVEAACVADDEWLKAVALEIRRCMNKYGTGFEWQLEDTVMEALQQGLDYKRER